MPQLCSFSSVKRSSLEWSAVSKSALEGDSVFSKTAFKRTSALSYLRGGNDKGSVRDRNSPGYRSHRALMSSPQVSARAPMSARHKYHFFSFQVQHITGFLGHS